MLRRAVWFFIKMAVLIAIVLWLVDHPGSVEVQWGGYIVGFPLLLGVVVAVVVIGVAAIAYRWWRELLDLPGIFGRRRNSRRQRRGFEAINQGLVAVAAGDVEQARHYARRSNSALPGEPLSLLLQAQTAQLAGDEEAAAGFFERMAAKEDTAFLGVRGLMQQALRAGDTDRAIGLAIRARDLQPKAGWAHRSLFDMQVRAGDFIGAEATMRRAMDNNAIAKAEAMEQLARVLMTRARIAASTQDRNRAHELLREAYETSRTYGPAVAAYARSLAADGNAKQANKVIELAWRKKPSQELAEAFGDLSPGETDAEKLARFRRLAGFNSSSVESDFAVGVAAIAAEDWALARRHLERAVAAAPGARSYRLMAVLERAEKGDIARARDWELKAEEQDAVHQPLAEFLAPEPGTKTGQA
jgi:HemY protein